MEYFRRAHMDEARYKRKSRLDLRIRSAALIDSPISGSHHGPILGLGISSTAAWLTVKGVDVRHYDTPHDKIGLGGCARDLYCEKNPNYGEDIYGKRRTGSDMPPGAPPFWEFIACCGNTAQRWHSYTYDHVATQSRDFFKQVWK